MGVLEAFLALVGLATLIGRVLRWYHQPPTVPPEEDVAAPYREGLHAAVRMQRVTQDLEARLYAEAASHANSLPSLPEHQAEELGNDLREP
jgi:hypothetical protein